MPERVPVSQRVPSVSGHSKAAPCPRVPPPTGGTRDTGRGPEGENGPTVSRGLPGVNAALANAVRVVNARFARLPKDTQDRIDIGGWDALEADIDAAILAGDRDHALAAIEAWRQHWVATFEEAAA